MTTPTRYRVAVARSLADTLLPYSPREVATAATLRDEVAEARQFWRHVWIVPSDLLAGMSARTPARWARQRPPADDAVPLALPATTPPHELVRAWVPAEVAQRAQAAARGAGQSLSRWSGERIAEAVGLPGALRGSR